MSPPDWKALFGPNASADGMIAGDPCRYPGSSSSDRLRHQDVRRGPAAPMRDAHDEDRKAHNDGAAQVGRCEAKTGMFRFGMVATMALPWKALVQFAVSLAGLLTFGHTNRGLVRTYSPRLLARSNWAMAKLRLSFPITVAGLFRTFTGFPILPAAPSGQPPVTTDRCTPPRSVMSRFFAHGIV